MRSEMRYWPIVAGAVMCSLIMAYVTFGIAELEFHWALWTRKESHALPFITSWLRQVYWVVWLLPAVTLITGALFLMGKIRGEVWVAASIACVLVLHVAWFFFWLLGLYLANQSFVA